MNPPWFLEIILGICYFRILEIIFVIILYDTLHSKIGLNIKNEEGFVSFGMKSRKVELYPSCRSIGFLHVPQHSY